MHTKLDLFRDSEHEKQCQTSRKVWQACCKSNKAWVMNEPYTSHELSTVLKYACGALVADK